MEWTLAWGGATEDLLVTVTGAVNVEGLDAWLQAARADPRRHANMRVLIDHRRADWSQMSTADVQRRATRLAGDASRIGSHRIAWVMGSKVDFGLVRMMQLLTGVQIGADWNVFDDIDAARAWLQDVPT